MPFPAFAREESVPYAYANLAVKGKHSAFIFSARHVVCTKVLLSPRLLLCTWFFSASRRETREQRRRKTFWGPWPKAPTSGNTVGARALIPSKNDFVRAVLLHHTLIFDVIVSIGVGLFLDSRMVDHADPC